MHQRNEYRAWLHLYGVYGTVGKDPNEQKLQTYNNTLAQKIKIRDWRT